MNWLLALDMLAGACLLAFMFWFSMQQESSDE